MKVEFHVQNPQSKKNQTLDHLIATHLADKNYENIMVSVAYMTVSGARLLLNDIVNTVPKTSKWLIGLDDCVTQPGAIDLISKIPGSEVRVATFNHLGLRFHPKVYIFSKNIKTNEGITILGSSNLTLNAFSGNGEANAVFEINEPQDFLKIQSLWDALWLQGHPPTSGELAIYKSKYEKNKLSKPKFKTVKRERQGVIILASDDAELDPSSASICWIECGYITAMGREIELKAEQGLFFGLSPTGEDPKSFEFTVSSGNRISLRMKFQKNHMWRLQLTSEVPEVAIGLRPRLKDGDLGRSPYVAIFKRDIKGDSFLLRFIKLDSAEFKKLVIASTKLGTYGKTTARQYGWC